jgi:hypothetical protein
MPPDRVKCRQQLRSLFGVIDQAPDLASLDEISIPDLPT